MCQRSTHSVLVQAIVPRVRALVALARALPCEERHAINRQA
jgi:hypothetical protein